MLSNISQDKTRKIILKKQICCRGQQSESCTAYGPSLNVQFCERSETWRDKATERENTMRKNCEMENNGKHVRENKRMRDKERAREMWVSKKCQSQASFRHEWETMRPGGVWIVREHTCKHARIPQAHTHSRPPHWARACASETGLWVYWGDWEGAVPFCRANEACTHRHKGVERVSTALLHPFTHFLPLHSSWWGNAFSLKGIP